MALAQALLHPQGHVGRDEAPDLIHVLSRKSILPQRRLHDIIVEPKERLRRLLHTRILAREPGHEERVLASRVELGVNSALREHSHLIRVQSVRDAASAVLEGEFRDQGPLDDDVDLGAPGMRVRGVEAAGADEAEGHADAGADEGGEDGAVGAHGVAAFAGCDGARGRVVEVVDEVGVGGDEVDAVFGCRGEDEGLDEILVVGEGIGALYVGQGGGVIERVGKGKSEDAEVGGDDDGGEQHGGESGEARLL